ncbi:MAG: AbrB/MazE/SpoVT family DNA-binding domain-containing protein [Dehalococcoidales bacterium]|nr:MAG: AbrB/MazE/SpoVT family DNA-binding domain-containing protein [Dehalococcoidales bacterium]
MLEDLTERMPTFYGSVTVGERGQVAVPAEARRDQEIAPGSKLLAFGGPDGRALVFVKAEFLTEFITNVSSLLSQFEHILKTDITEQPR